MGNSFPKYYHSKYTPIHVTGQGIRKLCQESGDRAICQLYINVLSIQKI